MTPQAISSDKIGLPPGTLVHIGEKKVEEVRIGIFEYDQQTFSYHDFVQPEECCSSSPGKLVWINVDGLHNVELIDDIGKRFDIHSLVLEDIANTGQRAKIDEFDDYLYVVLKMINYHSESGVIEEEQLSLILGDRYLLSFQEKIGDIFNPIRERIKSTKSKIKRKGCDYLMYSLIDAVVDHYYLFTERIGEEIEELEEDLFGDHADDILPRIHGMKKKLIYARKSMLQLREVMSSLVRSESDLVDEAMKIYFRDVHDHLMHLVEQVDIFREMVSGMLDAHLTNMSNKMNEVMKMLTVISTIFIPLTFLVGVYGMNFSYMPELQWKWGYPAVWGIMLIVMVLMVLFFRGRKWL